MAKTADLREPEHGTEPWPVLEARSLDLADIDEAFIAGWRALEDRALEGNAYLSPDFVLPVVRHLEPSARVFVVAVVAASARGSQLAGLGLFCEAQGGRRFPLRHLRAYQSKHSYLTGLLVDAEQAEAVLDAFFLFLTRPSAAWHGVAFEDWRDDGPLGRAMLRAAERRGATWHPLDGYLRAGLMKGRLSDASFEIALARCEGRDWRKKVKRLIEQGELQWRIHCDRAYDAAVVERFLALEDREWARAQGSSLEAAGEAQMFREICQGFTREGRLLMMELVLRGEVVASNSNFISGGAGFAFKIGWDARHAKLRPGILNDLGMLRFGRELGHLDRIDSGAQAGSFVDELWEDRISISSGLFATSAAGRVAASSWDLLRKVKRAFRRVRSRAG